MKVKWLGDWRFGFVTIAEAWRRYGTKSKHEHHLHEIRQKLGKRGDRLLRELVQVDSAIKTEWMKLRRIPKDISVDELRGLSISEKEARVIEKIMVLEEKRKQILQELAI